MSTDEKDPKARLIEAALAHVAFDGWSPATFQAAIADTGIDPALARTHFPRGAVDMAVAFHEMGDAEMARRLAKADLTDMRYRDRVAHAVRVRLECIEDKEAARRGATLFALPQHAALGSRLIWGTADAIWTALGDTSDDVNWYTKRATLSGVYGATVLYWLGDESDGHAATWAFIDRRIDDVMRIEMVKGKLRENPVAKGLMAGPNLILSRIKAPPKGGRFDIPGVFRRGTGSAG